jgi:hypothetical protein
MSRRDMGMLWKYPDGAEEEECGGAEDEEEAAEDGEEEELVALEAGSFDVVSKNDDDSSAGSSGANEREASTNNVTLTAPFVFVGSSRALEAAEPQKQRYGTTITLQPIVAIIGEVLRADARRRSTPNASPTALEDSLVELCHVTLEDLLVSGKSLHGVPTSDILDGVHNLEQLPRSPRLSTRWYFEDQYKCRVLAVLAGYLGVSATTKPTDFGVVGKLLCEFLKVNERRDPPIAATAARGLSALLVSQPEAAEADPGKLWTCDALRVVLDSVERSQVEVEQRLGMRRRHSTSSSSEDEGALLREREREREERAELEADPIVPLLR